MSDSKNNQFNIQTGGISCSLEVGDYIKNITELEVILKAIKPSDFVSGFRINNDAPSRPDFQLKLEQSDVFPYLSIKGDTYILYGDFNDVALVKNLPYIIYTIGERYRGLLLRGFTLHAAAVASPHNEGVLILGDKGTGKTSVLLALAKFCKFKVIGNDSVLLAKTNELSLLGGTKTLTVRTTVLSSLFDDKVPNAKYLEMTSAHKREDKITFEPSELGFDISDVVVPLKLVVRIDINKNSSPLVTRIPSAKLEALRIFQNISKHITGDSTPLIFDENGVRGYFPSLDTAEIAQTRNEIIQSLIKDVNFVYISAPSASEVPAMILKELQK